MTTIKEIVQHKNFQLFLRFLTLVLIILPMFLLSKNVWDNWQQVKITISGIDTGRGVLSILFLMLGFTLLPVGCQISLSILGYPLSLRLIFRKYFISQISKYVPGGIWIVPGRVVAFHGTGVGVISNSTSMLIELGMMVSTGTLAFLPYLLFTRANTLIPYWLYGVLLIPMIVTLFPPLLNRISFFFLERMGVKTDRIHFSLKKILPLAFTYLLFWTFVGIGFYFLVTSFTPLSSDTWLQISSSFSMAWIIGFLAFLTPSGLGVREGALVWLLIPILPSPLASVIAIVSRLSWSFVELLFIIIALIDNSISRKHIGAEEKAKIIL